MRTLATLLFLLLVTVPCSPSMDFPTESACDLISEERHPYLTSNPFHFKNDLYQSEESVQALERPHSNPLFSADDSLSPDTRTEVNPSHEYSPSNHDLNIGDRTFFSAAEDSHGILNHSISFSWNQTNLYTRHTPWTTSFPSEWLYTHSHPTSFSVIDDVGILLTTTVEYHDYNETLGTWILRTNLTAWAYQDGTLVQANSVILENVVSYSLLVTDLDTDGIDEILIGGRIFIGNNPTNWSCYVGVLHFLSNQLNMVGETQWGSYDDRCVVTDMSAANLDGSGPLELISVGHIPLVPDGWGGLDPGAQMRIWNWDGSNLLLREGVTWFESPGWGVTYVNSVSVGNLDQDTNLEIVTGGMCWVGTASDSRYCGETRIWNFTSEAIELEFVERWPEPPWYPPVPGHTSVFDTALVDVDSDTTQEVITLGSQSWWNGTQVVFRGQVLMWNVTETGLDSIANLELYENSYLSCNEILADDFDEDGLAELIIGGASGGEAGCQASLRVVEFLQPSLIDECAFTWKLDEEFRIEGMALGDINEDSSYELLVQSAGITYSEGESAHVELSVWHIQTLETIDEVAPTIDSPSDIVYEFGFPANSITWRPRDQHPKSYSVLRNGTEIISAPWDGSDIGVEIAGHVPSVYNYSLVVYDVGWNSASDSVFVTVLEAAGPIIDVTHSPLQPGHTDIVVVTATASDTSGVVDVVLSYSTNGGSSWTDSAMDPIGLEWLVTIPVQPIGTQVIYKAFAMDILGNGAISGEGSYTVVEVTSQIIAERYIRVGETLSGPRSASFLQHEYDIYEYANQGGPVVGYVIVNVTSLEAVDDQDLAHLILLKDLFKSNRQDLAVGFPNNAHVSWYSRADFCEDRAETWESVKGWLFWTNFLSLMWNPIGGAINILSTLVSIEEPLAYFNQFGTLVEDISENYSQVYSESPILSTLDLMATTFEAADIYIKLAYGNFLISMGEFANTRHLVTNIKMHLGGMVVGVFTDDHDAMYSDSIISVAAYTVMSKLADGIGYTYERMLSGPGGLEDYQSLYILQLLYYSAARALAVWKTSLAERYLESSSLSAWIAKALGKISEQDVVKWSLRAASDANRIREISDEYGVLESLAAVRANLLRYEGEEMLIASQEAPSDISPSALTMPPTTGMLLMPMFSASELGGKAKRKSRRKHRVVFSILGLFVALAVIVVSVVFFALPPVGFQYALPTDTPNFTMFQGPVSPVLTGHEAESLDYATYGVYQSESGENATIALVKAKSDSGAAWFISLIAAFAAANNYSVVGSTAGEWETVDLLSQVVSLRVCRSGETVLLIFGESLDIVDQLHNEILSYILQPG